MSQWQRAGVKEEGKGGVPSRPRRRRTRRGAAAWEARGDAAETHSNSCAARGTRAMHEAADAEWRVPRSRPSRRWRWGGGRGRVVRAASWGDAGGAAAVAAAARSRHMSLVEAATRCWHGRRTERAPALSLDGWNNTVDTLVKIMNDRIFMGLLVCYTSWVNGILKRARRLEKGQWAQLATVQCISLILQPKRSTIIYCLFEFLGNLRRENIELLIGELWVMKEVQNTCTSLNDESGWTRAKSDAQANSGYTLLVLAADKKVAQSEYESSMTQPDLLPLRRKALQGFRLN